jgi:hypothetical protein
VKLTPGWAELQGKAQRGQPVPAKASFTPKTDGLLGEDESLPREVSDADEPVPVDEWIKKGSK